MQKHVVPEMQNLKEVGTYGTTTSEAFFETIARIISDREGVEVEVKVTPAIPENVEKE